MAEVALSDLKSFCETQIKTFAKKQLVLLEGELGAGKTTVVQTVAALLGHVSAESPTFSVINEYPTIPKIYHVDLYRTESAEDIESTGFWDLFAEDGGLVFVEWSSRVPDNEWPRQWAPVRWRLARGSAENLRDISIERI